MQGDVQTSAQAPCNACFSTSLCSIVQTTCASTCVLHCNVLSLLWHSQLLGSVFSVGPELRH